MSNNNELLEQANSIINLKQSVTNVLSSKKEYEDAIYNKLQEDSTNRNIFINNARLLAGLSLEFRNIYGIEPPFYDITKCNIIGQYDVYDCQELINACLFDSENKDKDGILPCNKQRFFVDKNYRSEQTSFQQPFCPPGLNRWSGTYLHPYICKNWPLTEKVLINILSEQSCPYDDELAFGGGYYNEDFYLCKEDSSKNVDQIVTYFCGKEDDKIPHFTINKNAKMLINQYGYNISDEDLKKEISADTISFDFINGYDNRPIENFVSCRRKSNNRVFKRLESLHYGTAFFPFYIEVDGNSVDEGVGFIRRSSSNNTYADLSILGLKNDFDLYGSDRYYLHFKHPEKFGNWEKTLSYIAKFYAKMLDDVIENYDNAINVPANLVSTNVLQNLREASTAAKKFAESKSSTDLNALRAILEERLEIIEYDSGEGVTKSTRASAINEYLFNNKEIFITLFNMVAARIHKKSGSLREALNLYEGQNIALESVESKKANVKTISKDMAVYSFSSGAGSNKIFIDVYGWELENEEQISSDLIRNSIVIIAANGVTAFQTTILDSEKESNDENIIPTKTYKYSVTLNKDIPLEFRGKEARLIILKA